MPRNKSIHTEELIALVTEYRQKNPGKKVKVPAFGEYIRSRGFEIMDYTIRRNPEFMKYLESVNAENEEAVYNEMVSYRTLDTEAFLAKNRSRTELVRALTERDQYYARVARMASDAIRSRRESEKKLQDAEEQIKALEASLEQAQKKAETTAAKEKNEENKKLRKLLKLYVYPEMANALLSKEGILEVAASAIPEASMKENTITPKTDVENSVDLLFKNFDEEN